MYDFVIKCDRILTPQGIRAGYVLVSEGTITEVADRPPDNHTEVTDMSGYMLMPGVIDPHVHINEPGRTHWEGFKTATKAAIAGGITTLVDMPLNASPVTTTAAALEEKRAAAENKLSTNCGFWGGIVPGNATEIAGLVKGGVLGFKAFLTHSGIDDFPNVTESDLHTVMPLIAKHQLPLLVHCELSDSHLPATGDPASYQQYLHSRPAAWEDNAIALMIRLCETHQCRVHIVHLSSAGSIDQIRKAKEKGLPLTVETAQHYLYFNAAEIHDGDTRFKCAPPIREKTNNDRLWDALKEGIIDFVATDHSPAPPELKHMEDGDFTKAWGGIASLQFALPALWTAAVKRRFPLTDVVRWLCENPAKLIGKTGTKGKIEKGYDADFIIFDPDKNFVVAENMTLHKHTVTPYLNQTLQGTVMQTYLAGKKVFDAGAFVLHQGKILTP